MVAYKRIKQEKISDVVAIQLEKLVIQGVLVPGERLLSERDLACAKLCKSSRKRGYWRQNMEGGHMFAISLLRR